MKSSNEKISEALGIEYKKEDLPAKQEILCKVSAIEDTQNDQQDDYNLSRKIFKNLITKGEEAIDDLSYLAKSTETPRSYEVLATLIKTVADTTKDLYDLQKKTKELNKSDNTPERPGSVTVEKAVFVGSTAELLRKVKEEKQ